MASLDVPSYPPPPPPKKAVRPKITLQIPDSTVPMTPRGPPTAASVYWAHPRYHGKVPGTPASHVSDPHGNPYFNPFVHMYHNKASEFMFKQFEGFKDFTINTTKHGLSAGEKTAFWFYNKLKLLSRRWFTHLFLSLCLVLYSFVGAAIFMAIEEYKEYNICEGRKAKKTYSLCELFNFFIGYAFLIVAGLIPLLVYLAMGAFYVACQSACCFVFCS